MVNEMKSKAKKTLLWNIRFSDIILINGQKNFVGLYYDENSLDAPIVLFKCADTCDYYFLKIAQLMSIPCIEQKVLAQSLYERQREGEYILNYSMQVVADIYLEVVLEKKDSDLKEKNSKKIFDDKLNLEVLGQLYNLERRVYKSANKRFFSSMQKSEKQQFDKATIKNFMREKILELSVKYNLRFNETSNSAFNTKEFYLASKIDSYNLTYFFVVILMFSEQKIYVGTASVFASADFSDAENVLIYLDFLISNYYEKLNKVVKKWCKEFKINSRIYEMSVDSIKILLENNYKKTGIEYVLNEVNKTISGFYLKRNPKENNVGNNETPEMYEVCITYKEFFRNPNAFKELIESPRRKERWNFWCRKRKFRPEIFQEKNIGGSCGKESS